MTKQEIYKKIVDQEGICKGIDCKEDNCPFDFDEGDCVGSDFEKSKYLLTESKKRLTDWIDFDINNVPSDLFQINNEGESIYEFQVLILDTWRPISNIHEHIRDIVNENDEHSYQYRLKQIKKTIEDKANEWNNQHFKNHSNECVFEGVKIFKEHCTEAFIAGYNTKLEEEE